MQGVKYDGQGPSLDEINAIYRSVLGRDADPEGLAYWDKTNLGIGQLTSSFKDSDEYRTIQAKSGAQPAAQQPARPAQPAAKQQAEPKGGSVKAVLDQHVDRIAKATAALDAESMASAMTDGGGLMDPRVYNERLDAIKNQPINGMTYAQTLSSALENGVDLRPYYGTTYADAVKFKQDLGQFAGKDQSMIIPANPVGYSGQFQFDPNFGSTFYRDLATQAGKALGLSDQQILQSSTSYFKDQFYSGAKTKGAIGFNDYGPGLMDSLAGAAGVPADRLGELRTTALKPLYDASQKVYEGLNGAARIESQSSGFFKGIGQSIAKLGPIGTIALTAALGPAAGALAGSLGGGAALAAGLAAGGASALPGLLQGDLKGAIKSGLTSGALAGVGAGALKDVGNSVSGSLGAGFAGDLGAGAAKGAITGGVGALASGDDLLKGITKGAVGGGLTAGVQSGISALTEANKPSGSGVSFGKDAGSKLGVSGGGASGTLGGGLNLDGLIANAPDQLGQGLYVPTIYKGVEGYITGNGFVPKGEINLGDPLSIVNNPALLPQTTPGIGDQFSEVQFPRQGLKPDSRGEGFSADVPVNVGGVGGLGSGLTVKTTQDGVDGYINENGFNAFGNPVVGDPGSFINQPAPTTNPLGPVNTPSVKPADLIKVLLGGGAAAGIADGLGGLGGSRGNPTPGGTGIPGTGGMAPAPLQRTMSFTPQPVEYTSGLNGQTLQAPQYEIIDPQANLNAGYLRAFAAGGPINQGIGAVPGMAAGRLLEGPGDGMSDDIDATIEGKEPVRLADGEYIIPAQVVSALGNGSSKAGSKELDAMIKRVYAAQTGKPKQMKPMKTNKVLPA